MIDPSKLALQERNLKCFFIAVFVAVDIKTLINFGDRLREIMQRDVNDVSGGP